MQDTVDDDEDSAVRGVPACELVPNHDHGDAACEADHDNSRSIGGQVRQGRPGKRKHDQRTSDPIQNEGKQDVDIEVSGGEEPREGLVLDLCEDGPHHDYQSHRDGCERASTNSNLQMVTKTLTDRDALEAHRVERMLDIPHKLADDDPHDHAEQNERGQQPVEQAQLAREICVSDQFMLLACHAEGEDVPLNLFRGIVADSGTGGTTGRPSSILVGELSFSEFVSTFSMAQGLLQDSGEKQTATRIRFRNGKSVPRPGDCRAFAKVSLIVLFELVQTGTRSDALALHDGAVPPRRIV